LSGLRFLTAAQVAEILKLNQQVLVRKLQLGEIPAYKIGKDWRIEESELRRWLESVSNREATSGVTGAATASAAAAAEEEAIRRSFFVGNRLKTIPARRSRREIVLRILTRRFELGRIYREAEVNEILKGAHPDFCTLRRELVMANLMQREKGKYWRPSSDEMGEEGSAAPRKRSGSSVRGEGSAPRERT
jgi:excisionase family DNA binding protein